MLLFTGTSSLYIYLYKGLKKQNKKTTKQYITHGQVLQTKNTVQYPTHIFRFKNYYYYNNRLGIKSLYLYRYIVVKLVFLNNDNISLFPLPI